MKKAAFWTLYGSLLLAMTIAGLEGIASLQTPPWPAYELRPVDTTKPAQPDTNTWGQKDGERSLAKPPSVQQRVAFIGDSFLEGVLTPPLSREVERLWSENGVQDSEAVNLGVSATGPKQYYYRIKAVALKLRPDVILLVFYAGNDFVSNGLSPLTPPPLMAERPEPSILGWLAPRFTWLASNRLGLSEFGRGNKNIENETALLNDILHKPLAERSALLAAHLKKFYYPDESESRMAEILARGGERFWQPFEGGKAILAGWIPASIVRDERSSRPVPWDAEEADRMVDAAKIGATMTWLASARSLAESNGVKFLLAVAPVGSVDPDYVEFWKPWPRYYSNSLQSEANRRQLLVSLQASGFDPIDLEPDLSGVSGSYRLIDGHWTDHGTQIVAARIAAELAKVVSASILRKSGAAIE